ncbi:MAG TPA: S-layer homology domain-containing protein, partial [Vicinamibacteria bacterium]|nr:S-layer homology domain-containing protein [Vicinamibacteria bacterium]
GSATFTATATVAMTATDPIVNTATVAVPAGWSDPNHANNSATDTNIRVSAEPVSLAVDTAGNDVYEPNETVVVEPAWRNTGGGALALTGLFANHTGPAGATYSIPDATADYGTIPAGGTSSCTSSGNCYSVSNAMTTRPLLHWDTTVDESVPPTSFTKTWTLHVGASFADVNTGSGFYRFIETLLHHGITGGCSATEYCPGSSTTREQMAVFVLVAKEGTGYAPPACTTPVFNDVPAASPFCRWIEELARRGVVAGCGGGAYCPTSPVTREQMAVFVLRTLDPTLNPPACTTPMFNDVPASSPFCRWVEELVRRGVVTGCSTNPPLYCPQDPVTREQMGVFISVTFGLTLYGI